MEAFWDGFEKYARIGQGHAQLKSEAAKKHFDREAKISITAALGYFGGIAGALASLPMGGAHIGKLTALGAVTGAAGGYHVGKKMSDTARKSGKARSPYNMFTDGQRKRWAAKYERLNREKTAESLLGMMPGIKSGLQNYSRRGVVKAPKPPTPGVTVATRAAPQPLPLGRYQPGDSKTMAPIVKKMPKPEIPRP